ncbi:MAG: citramalate synthase, partial [Lentisphaerae bacterium]|nr:citramalate synthase [Lentisphaerota bacterium]
FFREIRRKKLKHARIAAFGSTRRARTRVGEDHGTRKLLEAQTAVVTIFGKSWRLHVRDVLRTTENENLAMIADTVAYLKERRRQVIYDAEHFFDGYKDSPAYALATLRAALASGADCLVLCDTRGGCLPNEVADITRAVIAAVAGPIGIHCHNDAELAVANTIEAVRAGAAQVQGTINGYGERCGNANLCAIIPNLALKLRRACRCQDNLGELMDLSRFVDDVLNLPHGRQAAYVGESAFAHKAGMHVDAVEKTARSFEHVSPEAVGNERRILISELSGGSNILLKAIEMGEALSKSSPAIRDVLNKLEQLEKKGYQFESADASFKILIQKVLKRHKPFFGLEGYRVIVEKRGKHEPCLAEATIKVKVGNEIEHTAAEGDGPINALDNALRRALTRFYPAIAEVALTDFRVRILDPEEATAAKTRVIIESSDGKDVWGTVGVSGNIIEACWEALVDSVEYKLFKDERSVAKPKLLKLKREKDDLMIG